MWKITKAKVESMVVSVEAQNQKTEGVQILNMLTQQGLAPCLTQSSPRRGKQSKCNLLEAQVKGSLVGWSTTEKKRRSSRLVVSQANSLYGSDLTILVSSSQSSARVRRVDLASLASYGTHGGSVDLGFAFAPTIQQMGEASGSALSVSAAGDGRNGKP
jgi:hypothetical protein